MPVRPTPVAETQDMSLAPDPVSKIMSPVAEQPHHEEFCTPQSDRGDGTATEPRIEVFDTTGQKVIEGRLVTLHFTVTRCLECGAQRVRPRKD